MSSQASEVSADIDLWLLVPGDEPLQMPATLRYRAADPWAVTAEMHVGADDPVAWTFGRGLLAEGMAGPSGLGDVSVCPGAPGQLHIRLSAPQGEASFQASAADVRAFLDRTWQLVPSGGEGGHVDVGEELASWLGQP